LDKASATTRATCLSHLERLQAAIDLNAHNNQLSAEVPVPPELNEAKDFTFSPLHHASLRRRFWELVQQRARNDAHRCANFRNKPQRREAFLEDENDDAEEVIDELCAGAGLGANGDKDELVERMPSTDDPKNAELDSDTDARLVTNTAALSLSVVHLNKRRMEKRADV
jgi:hypothetical protein